MHCIVHIRVGAYWPEREILIIVEGGRKVNMHFIFSIMQWGWGSQKRHNVNDYWDECRKHVSLVWGQTVPEVQLERCTQWSDPCSTQELFAHQCLLGKLREQMPKNKRTFVFSNFLFMIC